MTVQGDTLQGLIDYQEWGGREPRLLVFKTAEADANIREFTPATSKYVAITGLAAYQSYRGRISLDATSLKHLPNMVDTTRQAVYIYLKVMQQGKHVSLYSYTDELKTRYFLQHQGGKVQELGFKKYYYDQTSRIRISKNYIGQLWLAAMELQLGTPALKKKIESAQYQDKDLTAIVRYLNQMEEPEAQQKSNTRFFAGLGINRTSFAVEGQHHLASNNHSRVSYLPKISLGLDLFRNRHIQRFFFRGEVILHLAAADISSQQQDDRLKRSFNQSFIQPTVSLAPQLVYNLYNLENLKFNLGIGASLNFSAYANNIYHILSTTPANGQVLGDSKIKGHHQFTSFWYAFPLRAGLILNQKTDVSLLYFLPASISQYLNYSFTRSSLQLGLNYLFNSKGK